MTHYHTSVTVTQSHVTREYSRNVKVKDSRLYLFSNFFLILFFSFYSLFWDLRLEFSVISYDSHSHVVTQSCTIIEDSRRF